MSMSTYVLVPYIYGLEALLDRVKLLAISISTQEIMDLDSDT